MLETFFVDLAFDLLTSIQPLLSSGVLFAISAVLQELVEWRILTTVCFEGLMAASGIV
jgi:hypothetical protein